MTDSELIPMGLYARLSTYGDETTIEQQLEIAAGIAERNGGYIALTFTDHGEPAFDRDNPADRPGYGALVDALHNGEIEAVVAYASDRLWRSDIERGLYARDAVRDGRPRVFTREKTYDFSVPEDDLMSTIVTAFAKYESAVKRRRIRDQKVKRRGQGIATNPIVAFGWLGTRHGAEKNDGTTIYEPEAALIREAAKRVLAGTSYSDIAAEWNENPVAKKPRGLQPWEPGQVRAILCSPRTAGHAVHNNEIYQRDLWPAILDSETWGALVALTERRKMGPQSTRAGLWTGFVRCARATQGGAVCGAVMAYSRPTPRHKGGKFHCRECGNSVVGNRVRDHAYEWITTRADVAAVEQAVTAERGSDEALLAELGQAHRELDEWLEMLGAREITRTEYVKLRSETAGRIGKLERELSRLGAVDAFAPYIGRGAVLAELLAGDELTPAEHRAIFTATGRHLWVAPAESRGPGWDEGRLRVTAE